MIEIFFPTKDRPNELNNCLNSIFSFYSNSNIKISVANCSIDVESTSEILKKYGVNETVMSPDPGMNTAFNILLKNLTESTSLWLSDDIVLLKPLKEAYDVLVKDDLDLLGIGFIDKIHFEDPGWPVDEFKCAKWTSGGFRVSHFALCKSSILKNINLDSDPIDSHLFKIFGKSSTYKYLESNPFLEHNRNMDETRKNRKF